MTKCDERGARAGGNTGDLTPIQQAIGALSSGATVELFGAPFTPSVTQPLVVIGNATVSGTYVDSVGNTASPTASDVAYSTLTPAGVP